MNDSEKIAQIEEQAQAYRRLLAQHAPAAQALMKGETALQKAAVDASGLTQGSAVTGNNFNVLIPQDISQMVYSAMLEQKARCVFLNDIPRENVSQVKRERVIKKKHGDRYLPVGMGEAGIPGTDLSVYDKIVATVRNYAVTRQLSHLGMNVDILGSQYPQVRAAGKYGLETERREGIDSLAEKLEDVYWDGDNDFDADEGDGFFTQLEAGGTADINWFDLRGGTLTFDKLVDYLAGVIRPYYEGEPDTLYLPSELWAPISKEAATKNRLDPAKGVTVYWNKDIRQLVMQGPTGQELKLKHAMFVTPRFDVADGATAYGSYTTMAASDLVGSALTSPTAVSVSQTTYFAAAQAGSYTYKILPIFKKGRPVLFTPSAVTVAADDVVKFDFADAAIGSTENPLVGYRVWRSEKDSTTVFHYLGKFGKNTDGASSGTLFYDTNKTIPGTFRAAGVHFRDGAITDDVLLDTFQYDLGRVDMYQRMVLGTYRGLSLNMPRRHIAIVNAAGISF